MRGISAIVIACIYHLNTVPYAYSSGLPFGGNPIMAQLYRQGGCFVELFLLISGFVSFMVYTDKIDKGLSFSSYALKRMIRIFPLMIVCHLLAGIFFFVHKLCFGHIWLDSGHNSVVMFLLDIFGLNLIIPGVQSWNYPSWSLAVFFLCWIIYYIIVFFSRKTPGARIWACALVALFGIAIYIDSVPEITALFNTSAARGYISFFAGGVLYYLHTGLDKKQKNIFMAAGLTLVFLTMSMIIMGVEIGNLNLYVGAFLFPVGVFTVLNIRFLSSLLSLPPLCYLGKISFSIYLCNFPIEMALAWLHDIGYLTIDFSSPLFFFGNIILHILVASVFCKVFEEQIPRRLKQRYGL